MGWVCGLCCFRVDLGFLVRGLAGVSGLLRGLRVFWVCVRFGWLIGFVVGLV